MTEVRQTTEFSSWLRRLRDADAAARIIARIRRMEFGNPGDARSVGKGVMEMRIAYGPGYRIYYAHRGGEIVSCCAEATSAPSGRISGGRRTWRRDSDAQNDTI